jgi:hypothetical protein
MPISWLGYCWPGPLLPLLPPMARLWSNWLPETEVGQR